MEQPTEEAAVGDAPLSGLGSNGNGPSVLSLADSILETLLQPFLILDNDLRVERANRAFYEVFRTTEGETLGCLLDEIGGGRWAAPGLHAVLQGVLDTRRPVAECDLEHDFPTIGKRTMSYSARPFASKAGDPERVFLAMEDATYVAGTASVHDELLRERIRLEEATRDQLDELTDLHRRKDELLAMFSHELRNPLAPIASALALMRKEVPQTALQVHCEDIIERQVATLTKLVDDLVDASRVADGVLHLDRVRLDLCDVVTAALEAARPALDARRHELGVALPARQVEIHGDAARLTQLARHLLNNAIQYTEPGGRIDVKLWVEGREAVFLVRDSGPGIQPERLALIFDPLTQGRTSLDRAGSGWGMGLFLVQRITEMHGGAVEVCSKVGYGSEFTVRIPLWDDTATETFRTERPAPAETRKRSLRVLVVDDNVDSAESLAMLLRASGHRVRTAHSGPGALLAASKGELDIVVLDIGLPGMDGYEVATRMRRQLGLGGAVLIAMTGYGQESDRRAALDAGFDHHMVKPVDLVRMQQIFESA